MAERKRWPDHVEGMRLDAIALLLDIEVIQIRLEEANIRGEQVEVAKLNLEIARKVKKVKSLLMEARKQ